MSDTYQIDENSFKAIDNERLQNYEQPNHKPKVLLLYGSLRERSFSRLMTEEAALVVKAAERKTFNPLGCRYLLKSTSSRFGQLERGNGLVFTSGIMKFAN